MGWLPWVIPFTRSMVLQGIDWLVFLWTRTGRQHVTAKVGTNMTGSQYLYRRPSGTCFVRLCVPVRFKAAVGKGEIHRSTGCRDYRLAKIVAAELVAHWHRAIVELQRMDITKV